MRSVYKFFTRIIIVLMFAVMLSPFVYAIEDLEPDDNQGPFVLNFRFSHLFLSFFLDNPSEVAMRFNADISLADDISILRVYLNDKHSQDIIFQDGQNKASCQFYLASLLKGHHSVRLDLIQENRVRKRPEIFIRDVYFRVYRSGESSFTILRHTPLIVLKSKDPFFDAYSGDLILFSNNDVTELETGRVLLTYDVYMTDCFDALSMAELLATRGLPFLRVPVIQTQLNTIGQVEDVKIFTHGGWETFIGDFDQFNPVVLFDPSSKTASNKKGKITKITLRPDPTMYSSLRDERFFLDLPTMLKVANILSKRAGIIETIPNPNSKQPSDLSNYLFARFFLDNQQNALKGFWLEVVLKEEKGVYSSTKGDLTCLSLPNKDGILGMAVELPKWVNRQDIKLIKLKSQADYRSIKAHIKLDRIFALDSKKGTYKWILKKENLILGSDKELTWLAE